jgi:hypothetical protein
MYKIFVVTHKNIFDFIYAQEDLSKYKFVNISNNKLSNSLYEKYDILDIKDNNFIDLGKYYTESEVIYNVYKNNLYEGLSHIGFTHYDVGTKNLQTNKSVSNYFNQYETKHVNLQPFDFNWDFNQRILADDTQPETLTGSGKNCYFFILEKYNEFYGTNINLENLNGTINLCSCFILETTLFTKMMEWISWVIESKCLDKFDTLHRYRLQGGLLERFYAVWIKLNVLESKVFPVDHMVELKNY